jgi:preprotein translocase subunit SecD
MLHFARWKLILVAVVAVAGILYALPNLFPAATMAGMPNWLPHKQVNLGLDLQGGAHLLYQLDEKDMIEDRLGGIRGDVRETLRRGRIGYSDLAQDVAKRSVSVTIRESADVEKALTELRKLATPVGGNVFGTTSANDIEVVREGDNRITLTVTDAGLAHRITSAVEASIETIRRRVDALGTTEPSTSFHSEVRPGMSWRLSRSHSQTAAPTSGPIRVLAPPTMVWTTSWPDVSSENASGGM